jgi:hypothetical protein
VPSIAPFVQSRSRPESSSRREVGKELCAHPFGIVEAARLPPPTLRLSGNAVMRVPRRSRGVVRDAWTQAFPVRRVMTVFIMPGPKYCSTYRRSGDGLFRMSSISSCT